VRRTFLKYSLGGSIFRVIVFGGIAALCFWLAFAEPRETSGRRAWLSALNVSTDGWFFLLLFGSIGTVFAMVAAMSIWHFFVDEPAVIIAEEAICFHRSFPFTPDSIRYAEIQRVLFARADRLPKSVGENLAGGLSSAGSFGGNMGAKCRSALRIYYRSQTDKDRKVTIMDNSVEGGERAILQFGASLRRELKLRGIVVAN
jgi:hypothetical protein